MDSITINCDLIDREALKAAISSSDYAGISLYADNAPTITFSNYPVTTTPSFQDLLDSVKEQIKLQPMTCINCGGSIERKSMTCEFCGTPYRL